MNQSKVPLMGSLTVGGSTISTAFMCAGQRGDIGLNQNVADCLQRVSLILSIVCAMPPGPPQSQIKFLFQFPASVS